MKVTREIIEQALVDRSGLAAAGFIAGRFGLPLEEACRLINDYHYGGASERSQPQLHEDHITVFKQLVAEVNLDKTDRIVVLGTLPERWLPQLMGLFVHAAFTLVAPPESYPSETASSLGKVDRIHVDPYIGGLSWRDPVVNEPVDLIVVAPGTAGWKSWLEHLAVGGVLVLFGANGVVLPEGGSTFSSGDFFAWRSAGLNSELSGDDALLEQYKREINGSEAIGQIDDRGQRLRFFVGASAPDEFRLLNGQSMIGRIRLDLLQWLASFLLKEQIPGDFVETGTWRGGASILMQAILKLSGEMSRTLWVADSFKGLPPPDVKKYPADAGLNFYEMEDLAVSLDQVKDNFARYGLLDENIEFLEGWFSETLPNAPIQQIALLRLDGDLYESTMDALSSLYPKVSRGGIVVIDDYGAIEACRQAVHDYREAHLIDEPISFIDWTGAYWCKR